MARAHVTAVESAENLGMLRSLGAERVIDYNREDFTCTTQPFDVIMDVFGKSSFSRSLRALTPSERYLLANPGLSQRIPARTTATGSEQDLLHLRDLIKARQVWSYIDRQYPVEQLAEDHPYVE